MAAEVSDEPWAERLRALLSRHRRVVLGIAGAPGSGKSTFARRIVRCFDDAVHVPMDGFHLADVELDRLGRRGRKGAADTFDAYGYLALLQRIRAHPGHVVYAPEFDRDIEQPIAGAIPVGPRDRLVVTEGNYLLDDEEPWPTVRELCDEVWFLDIPPEVRRPRLIARHIEFGKTPEQAQAWVRDVDDPNAERIERSRRNADFVVRVGAERSRPNYGS